MAEPPDGDPPVDPPVGRGRGRRVNITASQAKLLAGAYDSGLTVRQVARRYGLSYGATHTVLHQAGVTMRPAGAARKPRDAQHPDNNPATRRRLAEQYTSGLSIAAVAARSSYGYATVRRVLTEDGVQVRAHGPLLEVTNPALAARLVAEYQADDQPSMRELARRHRLSYGRVQRALIRAGIPIRGNNWENRQGEKTGRWAGEVVKR